MLNSNHYTPILKWKTAEQGALASLKAEDKKHITPLVQFVMPSQKKDEPFQDVVKRFKEQSNKLPGKIIEVWGTSAIFLDFSLLYDTEPTDTTDLRVSSIQSILEGGNKSSAKFIPVIHLNDDEDIKTVVSKLAKEYDTGLCLRLVYPDFTDLEILNKIIQKFLTDYKLSRDEVDVMVDIKEIDENRTKYSNYFNLAQKLEKLSQWRSFIFASGSFPVDLSKCKLDEENLLPRFDWKNWLVEIKNTNIIRKPTFSDYTIQYPIYNQSSQFFHPSTSIKYTLNDQWLIMRGKQQQYNLYLANAKLLAEDSRFMGEKFSAGDKYISEKAKHYDTHATEPKKWKTGNAKTWIEAGISHHFALVVNQVSSLS